MSCSKISASILADCVGCDVRWSCEYLCGLQRAGIDLEDLPQPRRITGFEFGGLFSVEGTTGLYTPEELSFSWSDLSLEVQLKTARG